MRGAIVGFGKIAEGHGFAYKRISNITIVAVVDPVLERRKAASIMFPNARVYKTIEEAFSKETFDFIDICSAPVFHIPYIKFGLSMGCHVVCEKPAFLGSDHVASIATLISTSGKALYPSHNYKFSPGLKLMKQVIEDGSIGELLYGSFRVSRYGHAKGTNEWRPNWRRERDISGGGILADHGPHAIYLTTHLTKKTPAFVSCVTGNLSGQDFEDTEDTASLRIEYDKLEVDVFLTWATKFRDSDYTFCGTKGMVRLRNDKLVLSNSSEKKIIELKSDFDDPSHKSWFVEMFSDFIDTISDPGKTQKCLDEATMSCGVIEAGYESSRKSGERVRVLTIQDLVASEVEVLKS